MINEKLSTYKKNNDLQFKDFKISNLKSLLATQYQELEDNNKEIFNNFIELIKLKNYIIELNDSLQKIPLLENINNIVSITTDTFLNLETLPKNIISDVIDDIVEKKYLSSEKSDEYLVYVISLNLSININFNNQNTTFNIKYDFFINDWEKENGKYNISYLSQDYSNNEDFYFDLISLNITEDQLKKFLIEKLEKLAKKSKKNLLLAQIIRDKKVKIKLNKDPEYGAESDREIVINANDSEQFSNIARINIKFKTRTNISHFNVGSISTITFDTFKNFETDLRQKLVDIFKTSDKPIFVNVLNDENVELPLIYIRFLKSWTASIKIDATKSKKYTWSITLTFNIQINDISAKYISLNNNNIGSINFSSLKSNDSLYVTTTLKHLYLLADNNKEVLDNAKIQEFDSEIIGLEVDVNKNWYVTTKNNKLYSYNLKDKTKNLIHSFESDITKVYINGNKYYVGLNNGDLYYGESIKTLNKIQSLNLMMRDIALDKNNNLYVVTTGNLHGGTNVKLDLIQEITNVNVITFDNKNNLYVGTIDSYGKLYSGKTLIVGKYFMDVYDPISNLNFIDGQLLVTNKRDFHKIIYDFDNN